VYVGAGTVHTPGAGVDFGGNAAAIRRNYRLYDYGRPRELHLERGLAAIKTDAVAGKVPAAHILPCLARRGAAGAGSLFLL